MLIHPLAETYAKHHTTSLEEILAENEQHTHLHHPHSKMLSGHVQGKVLEMLSLMIKPAKMLEIGTFTGYSALCLLKGLTPDGIIHTIEIRKEDAMIASEYFERAGAGKRIKIHIGNALDIIPGLKEDWDLIFIDADKTNYINYYELTLPFLKQGGFIIADNVLFHGEVLEKNITGKNAVAIHAFNEYVSADKRVEQVMLTVRDGLMIIRKL